MVIDYGNTPGGKGITNIVKIYWYNIIYLLMLVRKSQKHLLNIFFTDLCSDRLTNLWHNHKNILLY